MLEDIVVGLSQLLVSLEDAREKDAAMAVRKALDATSAALPVVVMARERRLRRKAHQQKRREEHESRAAAKAAKDAEVPHGDA